MKLLVSGALLSLLGAAGYVATSIAAASSDRVARVAAVAAAFVDSLDDRLRSKACFELDDAERANWHFVPNIYPGVLLSDMSAEQRRGVHRLLRTVLSASGYHKTTTIVKLEDTLRELAESTGRKALHRDPGRYSLAFFGKPSRKSPWGFRFQGHHVSWNFTSVDNRVTSTPAFLGANPAEIRHGPHAGLRALPDEEDLARELLGSLDEAQLEAAVVSEKAPRDVLWGPGKSRAILGQARGIAARALKEPQRKILWQLVEAYAHNLKRDLAAAEMAKIDKAGRDNLYFAWRGSSRRGRGHYYCVRGPTFAIEYDNTQNGANHVHTVWHDLTSDFGSDLLREHYRKHHAPKNKK